jgi:hypothetical protein
MAMDYRMDAQTAYFNLALATAQEREEAARVEIAAILEKYGCVLNVQVASK